MQQREYIVVGKVQGVGFRYFTAQLAESLGIHGWVQNSEDLSVRIFAAGSEDALADFEDALHDGPPNSAVTNISSSVSTLDSKTMDSFEVRFEIAHKTDKH